jgi:hypothetical protein
MDPVEPEKRAIVRPKGGGMKMFKQILNKENTIGSEMLQQRNIFMWLTVVILQKSLLYNTFYVQH